MLNTANNVRVATWMALKIIMLAKKKNTKLSHIFTHDHLFQLKIHTRKMKFLYLTRTGTMKIYITYRQREMGSEEWG